MKRHTGGSPSDNSRNALRSFVAFVPQNSPWPPYLPKQAYIHSTDVILLIFKSGSKIYLGKFFMVWNNFWSLDISIIFM